MSLDRIVEQKLKEAIAKGELSNLAGEGKPLELEKWSDVPEEKRLEFSILKQAGFVPREVELMAEIDCLQRELEDFERRGSTNTKEEIRKRICFLQAELGILRER